MKQRRSAIGDRRPRPLRADDAEVDATGTPVIGEREQVLGGVDQLAGDAEHLGEHVRRAARQAAQRRGGAEQAVGGFVDRAIAAERDDHVIALVRGLAAQLGRVAAGLGVDRVDLEPALQRIHDEMAQAVGDSGRVRVDDDQHASLDRGDLGLEVRRAPRAGARVCSPAGAESVGLPLRSSHYASTPGVRGRYRAATFAPPHVEPLRAATATVALHPSARLLNFPAT